MSVWTHVCGNIYLEGADKELLNGLLGEMDLWHDDNFGEKSKDNPIPSGSEGSLRYKYITEGDRGTIFEGNPRFYDRGVVVIWGNLRDYMNNDEIKEWFNSIVYNENVFVRQGVLQIECVGSEVIEYDPSR